MKAIVYTSSTGHTAQYAGILGELTGLPVYDWKEAVRTLPKGTAVIYLGWLFANTVKGYRKASKCFAVSAVCAVGLCDTGTAVDAVRKVNAMPESLPLFTMQGGMDRNKLPAGHRFGINMLTKAMDGKKDRTEDEERMLYLLKHDANYVSRENTAAFMQWYRDRR